jgi:hypothetical protein
MAGRYTGSYPDQCSGWRAVAALADIGQASLVGRIPKDQYTLVEVVSKSASEGETDMASEHLYVADVPSGDIGSPLLLEPTKKPRRREKRRSPGLEMSASSASSISAHPQTGHRSICHLHR